MAESTKSPVISESKVGNEQNSRIGWIDKHAELIAKLEAQYQQPQNIDVESLSIRYFTFSVAGYNLLIPNHISSEILEDNDIYPIPLAQNWLIGACNVRGDVVPIIDLCQILNGETTDVSLKAYNTLILGNDEKSLGLLLDSVPTAVQFKKEESIKNYSKLPAIVKPFITDAFKRKNDLWVCLDLEMLIVSLTKL